MAYEGPHPIPVKSGGTGDASSSGHYLQNAGMTVMGSGAAPNITSSGVGGDTVYGYQAGATLPLNTVGGKSTFVGYQAGTLFQGAGVSGDGNSAFGSMSLAALTTGTQNSAFGDQSLKALNTGIANCAFGNFSLIGLTAAQFNSAFGVGALSSIVTGDKNTAVGTSALPNINASSKNVGIGHFCALNATSSTNSTYVGNECVPSLTTGTNNVAIGYQANVTSTSTNQIVIGAGATATADNQITIGNSSTGTAIINGVPIVQQFLHGISTSTTLSGAFLVNGVIYTTASGITLTFDTADNLYSAMQNPLYLGATIEVLFCNTTSGSNTFVLGTNMNNFMASLTLAANSSRTIKFTLVGFGPTTYSVVG